MPALLLLVCLAACQEEILHDLSEREANRVVKHLSVARLDAKKVAQADGRWTIAVARDAMVPALTYIDSQRVLADRESSMLKSKGSMIPSREDQWFRYERSLASSIEESLAAIPGVLEARVHVNLPDEDPLFAAADQMGGTGSVLLVVDSSFRTADVDVAALVAGAAGISREGVRVLRSEAPPARAHEVVKVESESFHPSPRLGIADSWRVALGVGVLIVLGIGGFGARRVVAQRRRKVAFTLPKELDFEGETV